MSAYNLIIHGTLPGLNEYTVASRDNRYAAAKMKKGGRTEPEGRG